MVLQDVFLFSGTIADNIGLGRADLDARDRSSARRARSRPTASSRACRDGYDTELRERGANLSAGQRQLLSFARALAHGGDVLVLDEATSSIDTETEALMQRGIHTLMEGKTALVIAHRLSTIQDVDRIHVLHHGRSSSPAATPSCSRTAASTRGSTASSTAATPPPPSRSNRQIAPIAPPHRASFPQRARAHHDRRHAEWAPPLVETLASPPSHRQ